MSNSSPPTPPDPSPDERDARARSRFLSPLLKVAVGLGVVAAAGGIVAVVWGDRLIETQVLPRVEDQLEETIGRPIDLGQVAGLSLWGVRLENIVIPPTDRDESTVTVAAAELDITLRSLIFQQTVEFDLRLIQPHVLLVQGADAQWLDFVFPEPPSGESRIALEIQSLTVEDASLTAFTRLATAEAAVVRDPVNVEGVDVTAEFSGVENQQVNFEIGGQVESGQFALLGAGDLNDRAIQTNVRLQSLPLSGVNLVLPPEFGLRSGLLNANLTVAADLTEDNELNLDTVDLQGTARFQDGEAVANVLPAPVSDIRSQLRFQGQQVRLEDTRLQLADLLLTADGTVDLQEGYDLQAQVPTIAIADVQSLADLELPIDAAGSLQFTAQVTGDLLDPQVSGRLTNREVVRVDQVELAAIAADFALNQEQFDLRELRIAPTAGGRVVAQGQADITDLSAPRFQLTAQAELPVDAFAATYGVTLPAETVAGTLTADIEAEGTLENQTAVAQWQLTDSSFPGTGRATLADNRLVVDQTRLQVADGTITANAIAELATGDWQAVATTTQVPVGQFTTAAEGLLSANLNAAGNLYDFDLATIQAAGDATIADAVVQPNPVDFPLLPPGDWTTQFEWLGDRLAVQNFSAPNLQADGTIGVDFGRDIPIGELALNVVLREFDLQPFNRLAPDAVREYGQIAGITSFTGQLTGTLDNPQVRGDARLVDLAVNQFGFERLSGPVDFSLAAGGEVDLRGGGDRVSLVVNADPWPVSFEIRNQEFVASGYGEGRRLYANVEQFPLAQLDVQPAADYGFGTVTGVVNVSVTADLADFQNPIASGTLTVQEPGLDPVAAEQFTAAFRYADNTAMLEQGELRLEDSRFLLSASATLQPEIDYTGQLTVAEGQIEDLVAIAQTIDLDALRFGLENRSPRGNAADLGVQSIRLPMASFLTQLEAFVAFAAARPEDDRGVAGAPEIPPLDDLQGEFTGGVTVAGRSLDFTDLTADFNLSGQSWQWGPYDPTNRFVVSGNVEQGVVTLDPVAIVAGETVVNLSGSGSFDDLQGELLVDNLPVALAAAVYPLPVAVEGDLDITSQFSGSLANPRVEGQLLVAEATIDEQPLDRVAAAFDYRNAVLEVDGEAAIAPDDAPMTLTGTIPYGLPFMTVSPPTDQMALTAIVPDDTFDFVNVLTADEVRWEGGDGEIRVQVGGTLFDPAVAGTATFQDGIVSTAELEQPLTDLNGQVQFNLQRVGIQRLQAQLGDGTLSVTGQLPLLASGAALLASEPSEAPEAPPASSEGILIALGELPIAYRGILDAQVDGEVVVTGAVLEPTISGGIALSDGVVRANQLLRQAGALNLPTPEEARDVNPYRAQFLGTNPLAPQTPPEPEGILDRVRLQEFVVFLRDRVVIAGQPFYNISADGGLSISGPLTDPRPDGEIDLRTGWINLFATQFRLDPNAPNSAVFNPEDGLNPYLDVVLQARVRDADITRIPPARNGFASSEISDNNIQSVGNVEFINVRAVAMGYAGELDESLTLTSNPRRSQEELIALLGSSVAGGLATANLTQVAGFVGAGGLAGFGNNVADALGLRSFSVFPTTDTSAESTAGIAIGMEASFAIGDSIGISVLEILNSGNPPQFGLQYRITDDLELQGSSNLNDTEVRLQYRTSF